MLLKNSDITLEMEISLESRLLKRNFASTAKPRKSLCNSCHLLFKMTVILSFSIPLFLKFLNPLSHFHVKIFESQPLSSDNNKFRVQSASIPQGCKFYWTPSEKVHPLNITKLDILRKKC